MTFHTVADIGEVLAVALAQDDAAAGQPTAA
jgi:hypothetical protein